MTKKFRITLKSKEELKWIGKHNKSGMSVNFPKFGGMEFIATPHNPDWLYSYSFMDGTTIWHVKKEWCSKIEEIPENPESEPVKLEDGKIPPQLYKDLCATPKDLEMKTIRNCINKVVEMAFFGKDCDQKIIEEIIDENIKEFKEWAKAQFVKNPNYCDGIDDKEPELISFWDRHCELSWDGHIVAMAEVFSSINFEKEKVKKERDQLDIELEELKEEYTAYVESDAALRKQVEELKQKEKELCQAIESTFAENSTLKRKVEMALSEKQRARESELTMAKEVDKLREKVERKNRIMKDLIEDMGE